MRKSFGAELNVYNEELFLKCCLDGLLPDIDECVILNGGPDGPSTDASFEIIEKYIKMYPDKIKYFEGFWANPDGTWDETSQVNFGFSHITTDFVIRTQCDMIFDYGVVHKIKEAIQQFSHKKFFYAHEIDFFIDTNHIRLYDFPIENNMPHPVSVDPVAVSMESNPRALHIGEARRFGMTADIDLPHDFQWLADVKKYHFGYVRPFKPTFFDVLALMKCGNLLPLDEMATLDNEGYYRRALKHVLDYKNAPHFEYCGHFPDIALSLKGMSLFDGYEEFMEWFNAEPWRE